uniref:Potassium/proton antiporter CemA n=1 Tax=Phacotus lenticularis TaxID=52965 RepID=A0A0S2LQB8_9CHLO|nr:chloroplast enveloppe membrane protein [Phacotus lenticularis]ALO63572.1 chloroplast enveloppe membrane protein [Phacotus lenticularis]
MTNKDFSGNTSEKNSSLNVPNSMGSGGLPTPKDLENTQNSLKGLSTNLLNSWNFGSLNNTFFSPDSNSKTTKKGPDFNFKNSKKSGNSSYTSNKTTKGDVVSVTYEEIGLWPRSFSRVLDRFLKQVFSDVENLVIQEYRFYRYLFLTTVRCLSILFIVPFLVNFFAKNYLIHPLTEYFWNSKQTEIFLNSYQQKHAFAELKEFEEKLYFESFISSNTANRQYFSEKTSQATVSTSSLSEKTSPFLLENLNVGSSENQNLDVSLKSNNQFFSEKQVVEDTSEKIIPMDQSSLIDGKQPVSIVNGEDTKKEGMPLFVPYRTSFVSGSSITTDNTLYKQKLQEKTIEIATRYNEESIEAITNFFADLLSLLTLFYLLFYLEIQLNITKSFLLEVFFGLDDSKKSLFILLVTDLLVGYHSSNIWELFFEFIFHHYGLPESQTGIFLLVATLPVLLDVLFKYLIFRHLNRSSPATVATYHAMIE